MTPHLERQIKISKMLSYGFIFSIIPAAGIFSIVSLVIGIKARRMIRRSEVELSGIVLAWWCIIAGSVNTLVFTAYFLSSWVGDPGSDVK